MERRSSPGRSPTAGDCADLDPTKPGHSEVGNAALHDDVQRVRIDGYPVTLESAAQGAYPYWQTEFAYAYGDPPADSVAAGFLRYLANEVGKDILRSHGNRPCSELAKPLLCRPTRARCPARYGRLSG